MGPLTYQLIDIEFFVSSHFDAFASRTFNKNKKLFFSIKLSNG